MSASCSGLMTLARCRQQCRLISPSVQRSPLHAQRLHSTAGQDSPFDMSNKDGGENASWSCKSYRALLPSANLLDVAMRVSKAGK